MELAGCRVVADDGGACRVERFGLQVFVEVGGGDTADPEVVGLEVAAWADAGGDVGC